MAVIKMNGDKSLSIALNAEIYQGEKGVDILSILIPKAYYEVNLEACNVFFRYILPDGTGGSTVLQKEYDERYPEYFLCRLIITDIFSAVDGKIEFWLVMTNDTHDTVLITKSNILRVNPTKNIHDYTGGENPPFLISVGEILGFDEAVAEKINQHVSPTYTWGDFIKGDDKQ